MMKSLSKNINCIEKNSECIVLIHGLARTSRCMSKAAKLLAKHGYKIINIDYPSRQKEISSLTNQHLLPVIKNLQTSEYKQIHFLTHSMGGILLRLYLSTHSLNNLGNVVMLAPPNQGSEIVDKLGDLPLFNLLNGPAGQQLGTTKNSLPMLLGGIDFDVGIIMGNRSINPLLSLLIPGKNDGKVSIERAKVEGMKDFLLMPYTHSFIMQRTQAIYQALYFIQNKQFYR